MRILLTGRDGFTGHYVSKLLSASGHDVIDFKANLRDPDEVEAEVKRARPEAVLHLAAQAYVAHSDTREFYDINLIGTNTLLSALQFHSADLKVVILASTAAVYGNRREGVLSEDMTPDPVGHYAVSKLAMEHAARVYESLPITIVRPFNYTGVGQAEQFVIPKIVSHFAAKKDRIELGNIDVFREFGDVRATSEIYLRLLDKAPVGEVLNLCTGVPYALRDALDLCAEISGHSLKIEVNPEFVRAQEVKSLTGNPTKLKSVIGELPTYELKDTLEWMLKAS